MNQYYVYKHVDPETKELMYVGMGKGSRAYATKTVKVKQAAYGHRSPEHAFHLEALLKDGYLPHEWIEFVERSLTKRQALKIEKELVNKLKPFYNRKFGIKNLKFDLEGIRKMKELRDQGLSYKNIGKQMKCSTMVAYRILNNQSPNYTELLNEL